MVRKNKRLKNKRLIFAVYSPAIYGGAELSGLLTANIMYHHVSRWEMLFPIGIFVILAKISISVRMYGQKHIDTSIDGK